MTTAAATRPAPRSPARRVGAHDRLFYGGMAVAMGLVASIPARLLISGTGAWRAFAEFLTR